MNIFIGLILMASWETSDKKNDILPIEGEKKSIENMRSR